MSCAEPEQPRARVLVVDDDPLIRRVVRRMLTSRYDVVELGDGAQALAVLEAEPDAFALVLCDLEMPEMGGLELWVRLSARRSSVLARMVFMSGGAVLDSQLDFLEARRPQVLDKPFSVTDVRELVAARIGDGLRCTAAAQQERAA